MIPRGENSIKFTPGPYPKVVNSGLLAAAVTWTERGLRRRFFFSLSQRRLPLSRQLVFYAKVVEVDESAGILRCVVE
jgi:hypothetical protein